MKLTEELSRFLIRNKLSQSDCDLILRAIEELRELEGDETRSDAHEKAEFEKAFPLYKKRRRPSG